MRSVRCIYIELTLAVSAAFAEVYVVFEFLSPANRTQRGRYGLACVGTRGPGISRKEAERPRGFFVGTICPVPTDRARQDNSLRRERHPQARLTEWDLTDASA
jgi:hypothetical protein